MLQDKIEAPDVKAALAALPAGVQGVPACVSGINVAVSTGNSSRLDFAQRGLRHVVRASFHYYNSDEDVEALAAAVAHVAQTSGSGSSAE